MLALALTLTLTGCAWMKRHPKGQLADPHSPAAKPTSVATTKKANKKAIVTPDAALTAKVISVNTVGRFVVLHFPAGQMPKLQQTLFLYHAGLKTAEVKITGPQHENDIVADLVSGEAQVGALVRSE